MTTPVSVRLYGIDAPETGQTGGPESTAFLAKLLPKWAEVEIIPYDVDKYSRIVGLVIRAKRCVNARMIEAGHAWLYAKYCKAKFCKEWARLQKEARSARLGLWKEQGPTAPWLWRKSH